MTVLMSMGRLLYVYILLMGSATGAVNARFLIHKKQINPYANSSLLSRYLTCGFKSIQYCLWSAYIAVFSVSCMILDYFSMLGWLEPTLSHPTQIPTQGWFFLLKLSNNLYKHCLSLLVQIGILTINIENALVKVICCWIFQSWYYDTKLTTCLPTVSAKACSVWNSLG